MKHSSHTITVDVDNNNFVTAILRYFPGISITQVNDQSVENIPVKDLPMLFEQAKKDHLEQITLTLQDSAVSWLAEWQPTDLLPKVDKTNLTNHGYSGDLRDLAKMNDKAKEMGCYIKEHADYNEAGLRRGEKVPESSMVLLGLGKINQQQALFILSQMHQKYKNIGAIHFASENSILIQQQHIFYQFIYSAGEKPKSADLHELPLKFNLMHGVTCKGHSPLLTGLNTLFETWKKNGYVGEMIPADCAEIKHTPGQIEIPKAKMRF